MALSPIEALFRKSVQYQEALQEFTDGATARLAEIRSEYETLSAALQGNVTPAPTKKTAPPAKKSAPPQTNAVSRPVAVPDLPSVVEDEDVQSWVVTEDNVEDQGDTDEVTDTIDLTESEGVWGDPDQPDDY